MNKMISKLILILVLLLSVEVSACDITLNEATELAFNHLGDHSDEFSQWFNEKATDLVQDRIENDGFYDEEFERFFFPLLTIRSEYLKGSLWIEVMCDGTSRSRHYLEEI